MPMRTFPVRDVVRSRTAVGGRMEGTWSLQIGPEVHSGLTLFRLEALVRSGTLEGHHRVCADGKWMRVDEVPYLRRQLDLRANVLQAVRSAPKPTPRHVKVGNVVHLFPEVTAAKLPLPSDRDKMRKVYIAGRVIMVLAVLVLVAEMCFLMYAASVAGQ